MNQKTRYYLYEHKVKETDDKYSEITVVETFWSKEITQVPIKAVMFS